MTFTEITRLMLSNMDFFQLRNVAKKYDVPFRGVRRQQLMRNIERLIIAKSAVKKPLVQGATSAKPVLTQNPSKGASSRRPVGINTFSARNSSL